MDKAHDVSPLIPMLHWGGRALAVETPHLVKNRLEPNAMLVDRPQLGRRLGERRGDLTQERTQTLLKVRLRLGVGVAMAWPRQAQMCAEPAQIDPTQLTANRPPQALRHPSGDGASVPAVKLRSRPAQRRT